MSVRVRNLLMEQLGALRHEPTEKRIRAELDGATVVDSTRALLVWEPKRIVPTYAVPVDDVAGELVAAMPTDVETPEGVAAMGAPQLGDRPVYDPSIPFSVHTTDGEPLVVRVAGSDRAPDAFKVADPDLDGYVLLDFAGFDAWYEEDELNLAHPRDPFHRVDIVHSSRAVRVELDGEVLAESTSAHLLFEPPLPTRYYFPIADVRTELLEPSELLTRCAYKGEASYFSVAGETDVAWGYRDPLRDSAEITGRIAFFNERVDIFVDGELQERPITPWSRRQREG
jgi:uncharacterized protein (DUF427 family)